jgi:hypothetical protein
VQREYLRQWKEVTARDGTIQPQTILSTLWYLPVWFKYTCIPYILRYMLYCVWVVVKAAFFRLHKALVIQGAGSPVPNQIGIASVVCAPLSGAACCLKHLSAPEVRELAESFAERRDSHPSRLAAVSRPHSRPQSHGRISGPHKALFGWPAACVMQTQQQGRHRRTDASSMRSCVSLPAASVAASLAVTVSFSRVHLAGNVAVLGAQGCKLDAWLAERGGQQARFSRRQALERYHFKAGRFSTVVYRVRLLLGAQVRTWLVLSKGCEGLTAAVVRLCLQLLLLQACLTWCSVAYGPKDVCMLTACSCAGVGSQAV